MELQDNDYHGPVGSFGIVTYNAHGLNTGRSYLMDLCNDPSIFVIALQEHWLTPHNLSVLNSVHPDFMGYGISAMGNRLKSGVFKGRPYGGVAFLWRRSIAAYVDITQGSSDGRCLCMSLNLNDGSKIKLITVYFPCSDAGIHYVNELSNCLGFLESVISTGEKVIVLGDMNFVCDESHRGFKLCCDVFNPLCIRNCDALCSSADRVTYLSNSLGHSSFIDHFFVSDDVRCMIESMVIADSGANLSDHRAVIGHFKLHNLVCSPTPMTTERPNTVLPAWRWDKADTSMYYEATRQALSQVPPPVNCYDCSTVCNNTQHRSLISSYYNNIVDALEKAATLSVPRLKSGSLKPFWNDELDRLKEESIFWHNLWLQAGRPASGTLQLIKSSCRLKYRSAIRDAYCLFERAHDNEICRHWLAKKPTDFWKVWHKKFSKKIDANIVLPGCHSDQETAEQFASHFKAVYYSSGDDSTAVDEFLHKQDSYAASNDKSADAQKFCAEVSVELIDGCIRRLHVGKACGPDSLSAEHLLYAHPSLIVHLKLLFGLIFLHGFVPDEFGSGIIVPLIKDKSGNLNDTHNYRPITLTPVISKVFENVILSICQHCFMTDELQFGFKKNTGCSDAIFAVKSTVNYFVERGSCVYAATLDLKKAFDSVNHFKMFSTLLDAGIPLPVVDVMCNWYSKLFAAVRWNSCLSLPFSVGSGVRQGSSLSPALFNLYINIIIASLKSCDCGCYIRDRFFGCFMYADDIIILAPSLSGLQSMLDTCTTVCKEIRMEFNNSKCYCIVFGKCPKSCIDPMRLDMDSIHWAGSVKYLGVYINGGKNLSFDIHSFRRSFYAAFNNIHSHAKTLEEPVQLALFESYCLPLLTFAAGAVTYSKQQVHDLNVCWNTMYRTVFNFNRWESVKSFINGLGKLSLQYILKVCKVKFYFHLLYAANSLLLDLFWLHYGDCYSTDDCLRCVFGPRHAAVNAVYEQFRLDCLT